MIFLKDLNVLFLKPKKVAGTSFELILSRFASASDIITPLAPEDEKTRAEMGVTGPQNYKKSLSEFTAADYCKLLRGGQYPKKFINHISAAEARRGIGAEAFDNAFKISIVRNPFDMLVSQYHWRVRKLENPPAFKDWLRQNPQLLKTNAELYYIDGQDIIDFYIRYESIGDDIAELEKRYPRLEGAAQLINEINAKGKTRPKGRSLPEYYEADDALISSVRFFNEDLIEKFGYGLD